MEISPNKDHAPYRGHNSLREYFLSNRKRYAGLNRSEIASKDPGFYRTVLRRGLSKIIFSPLKKHSKEATNNLSFEFLQKCYDLFFATQGNVQKVREIIGVQASLVRNIWMEIGLNLDHVEPNEKADYFHRAYLELKKVHGDSLGHLKN